MLNYSIYQETVIVVDVNFTWAHSDYRSLTRQNCFWTRTRTMLLLNIRLSLVLQIAPLFLAFSHLYLKNLLNHQNSLLLVPNLRFTYFLYSSRLDTILFFSVHFNPCVVQYSNNCKLCLKLLVQRSHTIFVV